ncbi:MAG: energy-coupling factor transporter ATPase [Bacillota bacterium]
MPITFEDVSYVYDAGAPWEKRALRDINLRIEDGEFVGIVGPTGSGKSTLVQHLNGLLLPASGRVVVGDIEVGADRRQMKKLRRKVGLVFQYPEQQLFEETVRADIAFGPGNMDLDQDEIDRRVEWACEAVGLEREVLERSPFELSGGQMRRAAIAGVLAMKCEVLALDEPTAGLDPRGRAAILRQLRALNRSGMTLIMVSHSIDDLAQLADRIVVMWEGRIGMQGETREVFRHVEQLQALSLDVPQIARIMLRLREAGLPVPTDVLTVDEAAEALAAVLRGGQTCCAGPA